MSYFDSIHSYTPTSMNQNTPENQITLNKALISALAETQDIVADSTNPFHKNSYASLSKHLEILKPIFSKHGLGILQFPIGDSDSVGIRTIIIHTDGGSIKADALIPADKEMSGQDAGSIYSYLRRYSLASVAGVATEDCDAETNRMAKSVSKPTAVSKPATKFIANPNFGKTAVAPAGGDVLTPFGDLKGQPLSSLPLKSNDRTVKFGDLNYFANVWKPKPFGDNTDVSPRDLRTKAEAERLWAVANSITDAPAEDCDQVPF